MTRVSQYYQKISDDQLRQELRQMRAGGLAWRKIAELYGINHSTLRGTILHTKAGRLMSSR